jgi:hypothetical protein
MRVMYSMSFVTNGDYNNCPPIGKLKYEFMSYFPLSISQVTNGYEHELQSQQHSNSISFEDFSSHFIKCI